MHSSVERHRASVRCLGCYIIKFTAMITLQSCIRRMPGGVDRIGKIVHHDSRWCLFHNYQYRNKCRNDRQTGATTRRSMKMPGVMMCSGSISPSSTNSRIWTIDSAAAWAIVGLKFRADLL
jgi:hypothetical protein